MLNQASPDPIQPLESIDEEENEALDPHRGKKTCKDRRGSKGGHVEMEEETEPYSANQGMSGIAFLCQKLGKVEMDSSPGPRAGA